ncbi:outer membrane protein assembly factor BamD [Aquimarina sp. W85]|uniref:outer membrane protein assembly factor BamD n=1 Tax=Aquimarina rhodophyticola TaxID=3342246 RepID=UPI00366DB08F
MKKVVVVLISIVTLASCSEYQKILKSEDASVKYAMAEKLYKEEKYKKALRLFEQIVPQYRGKPQAERVMYYYADTYYQLEDHYLSGYQFERFVKSYPKSDKSEEAAFKSAKSYYFLSPRFTLDQADTDKAIEKLQLYINDYDEGTYLEEANAMVTELRVKKEKKAYEIAKNYHHREDYKVAIASFNNFLVDYPGSPFRESVLYYKLESQYLLAIGSYQSLVAERLKEAKGYYTTYKKYYKTGEYNQQAEDIAQDITSRLEEFK